jgi:aldehyde dehydrogenase (NAD+)
METVLETSARTEIDKIFRKQVKKALELRTQPVSGRAKRLKALRQWIKANRGRLQEAIYADFKKPAGEVDGTEIFHVLAEIKLALEKLETWSAPQKVDAPLTFLGTRSYVKAEPRGVCLIIAPWNYPFSLAVGPLVSALAAGNTVVIKPSETTPHTSTLIAAMAKEIFDETEVTVVEGDASISQYLTSLSFDHIFFTGSPAVGKLVMKAAAENLTSVTLELGGKSPAFVTASVNMNDAAERITVAKFINCGQTCIAPDYVLVEEKMAGTLVEALKEKIKQRFTEGGESLRESKHYTRLVNRKHWLRMGAMLEDALAKGAKLELGGEVSEADYFFHPTLLTNVPKDSKLMEEEIFGPILPIITYTSLTEAIAFVNSRPKPLALYLYSQSSKEQQLVTSATSSGAVCINDSAVHFLNNHLPFGGVNNSGLGNTHGHYGFLAFSHLKPVMKQRKGLSSAKPLYPPYTKFGKTLMNWLLKMF